MIGGLIERLRSGDWLDAGRVRGYLILFALLDLAVLAFLIATAHGGVDRNGFLLGTDFLSFWSEGRLLAAGGAPYDAAAHIAVQRQLYPSATGFTAFFYPPGFLPLVQPLGALDYFPALALWLTATGAAFAAALRSWARDWPWPRLLLALAAFPAALLVVTHGQTSFLVAALLGGGAALLANGRANWAGVLFGLATIKPQFGLLIPLVLLAAFEGRAFAVAVAVAVLVQTAPDWLFGSFLVFEWLDAARHAQDAMASGAIGFEKMVSPFAALRLAGAGIGTAYAVQAIAGFSAAAALVLAAWRRGFSPGVGAALLAGAPLTTPFVLDYDLVLLAFPLAWVVQQPARPWERSVAALAFALPAFARPLAMTTGLQIAPLVVIALFAVVVRRALADGPERKRRR